MENVYVAAFSAASAAVAVVAVVFVAITDAPPWHAAPYLTFIIVDVFYVFACLFAWCSRYACANSSAGIFQLILLQRLAEMNWD